MERKTRSTIAKKNPKPTVVIRLNQREKDFLQTLDKEQVFKIMNLFSSHTEEEKPLRMSVLMSNLPDHIKMKIFNSLMYNDSDKYVTYVRNALSIPINISKQKDEKSSVKKFLNNAIKIMDKEITGHQEAKNEVLKLLCQWKTGGKKGCTYALGLEGEPGTGKTTFVKKALAEAMGLPLVFTSLGGCTDSSFLSGSVYTYEGSSYGRLVSGLIESQCDNPIFFFDELDKISSSSKGEEIVNTLIHLIDPAQNSHIRDKYFSFDVDFSKCVFVFSYNDASKVNPVLLDRIKRIKLQSPTSEQKLSIIHKHIIPAAKKNLNTSYEFDDNALSYIVDKNSSSTGMRNIERDVEHVLSCAQLTKSFGSTKVLNIDCEPTSKKINIEFTKKLLESPKNKNYSEAIYSMYT